MAKIDWKKNNERRKVREQGWETVAETGYRGDAHSSQNNQSEAESAEAVRTRSRARKPSISAGEKQRIALAQRARERKLAADSRRFSSKVSKTTKAQPTAFEKAYLRWLNDYANAAVDNQLPPPIPSIIEQRYPGPKLNSWKKAALRTARYATALESARKAKTQRG